MLALSGASAAMAEEPPSVWPKDIYSTDENATASENPGDEAEGAPAQTVDLSNPDIDWSQLDPATAGTRQGAGRSESQASLQDGAAASWSAQDKANGAAALSVRQSHDSVLGYAGRRRSHRRPAATRCPPPRRCSRKSPPANSDPPARHGRR